MATGGDWKLTDSDIARLAAAISSPNLESIAVLYLGIDIDTLGSMKQQHRENIEAFNRDILQRWANKNPGPDQVQALASILYKAAGEGSYVKVDKVQEILGVPPDTEIVTSSRNPETEADPDANITEDVAEMINQLKEHTKQASRIPLAPWAEDYTVDMEEAYVKLCTEKIENKSSGPEFTEIEHYAELFEEKGDFRMGGTGKKILGKGDPGMGKSTFGMKVAFDWATGIFTAVSIVFFVSLKLVRPGDSIENIIIQQTPKVETLGRTEQKLKQILDTFGSKVLLIVDGLDEHELGSNEDIQKIIEGRKLFRCNILLTSRPHCTDKIERYFPTVVRINGFTKDRGNVFVSMHLKDKDKAQAVLELNAEMSKSADSSHSCPMLLLFICVLVNSDELPLTQKVVHLGEIYFRLVRCIYRRYCVRKNIEFDDSCFLKVLIKVGRLAWEMLQSDEGYTKRSKVIAEIGEDSFEYGFLIGQKDFKLLGKETSDIFLTFVHRTIQEFLGAYFVIQSFDTGENVTYCQETSHICQTFIQRSIKKFLGACCCVRSPDDKDWFANHGNLILSNDLYLRFCLWLLCDECDERFLSFKSRRITYEAFISDSVKRIDFKQLDLEEIAYIFPSLDIAYAHKLKNDLVLKFIQEVLSVCRNTKELYLNPSCPSDLVFESISHLLPSLQLIGNRQVVDQLHFQEWKSAKGIVLLEKIKRYNDVRKIVTFCENAKIINSLYLLAEFDPHIEMSEFMNNSIGMLYLFASRFTSSRKMSVLNPIQLCPFLTQLSLVKMNIDESVLVALSTAVQKGRLPKLNHLSFEGCSSSLRGKLSKLFQSVWPQLTHLNLGGCNLDEDDFEILMDCLLSTENKKLPVLTSLVLHSTIPTPREESLTSISVLHLRDISTKSYQNITTSLNQGQLPNLDELSISMSNQVDRHTKLNEINVPTLTNLTLNGLIHTQNHLYTAVKSGKCPNLQKLDISHSSGITGTLSILLLCDKFPSLNTLILSDCGLNSQDLCSLAQASAKGRLPELRHLDISHNADLVGQLDKLFSPKQNWPQLCSLNTEQKTISDEDFQTITSKVQTGNLSSLQELWVSAQSAECLSSSSNVPWPSLRQLHVWCDSDTSNVVNILKAIAEAVERELLPNLASIATTATVNAVPLSIPLLDLTENPNVLFDPELVLSTKEYGLQDETRKEEFDAMMDQLMKSVNNRMCLSPDLFTHQLGFVSNSDLISNPAFRSAISSTMRSIAQLAAQCEAESRPLDVEAVLRIYRDELIYNPSIPMSDLQRSINDKVARDIFTQPDRESVLSSFTDEFLQPEQTVDWGIEAMVDQFTDNIIDLVNDQGAPDVIVHQLGFLNGPDLTNNPAYRPMILSVQQLIDQCVAESQLPDLEAAYRIMRDEFIYNPEVPMPDLQRTMIDTMLNSNCTMLKSFLQSCAIAAVDLVPLKHRLRKRGVRVYTSEPFL